MILIFNNNSHRVVQRLPKLGLLKHFPAMFSTQLPYVFSRFPLAPVWAFHIFSRFVS